MPNRPHVHLTAAADCLMIVAVIVSNLIVMKYIYTQKFSVGGGWVVLKATFVFSFDPNRYFVLELKPS